MNNTKHTEREILVKEIEKIQFELRVQNYITTIKAIIFVGLIVYAFYLKM